MPKVRIKSRFRDKFDHVTWYEVGAEVEFTDKERVNDLVSKGWVETIQEPRKESVSVFGQELEKSFVLEGMKSIGVATNPNITASNLEAKIEALDEDQKVALKKALEIEE